MINRKLVSHHRLIALLCGLVVSLPAAHAQPAVSSEVSLVSSYHWRGYELADRPALQGSVEAEAHGFSLSVWGSAATADRGALGAADELDVTLAYGDHVGLIGWSVGLAYYTFPNQGRFAWSDHATPEAFVALAPEVFLYPTLALYYDFHLGDGFYASLGVGHEVAVGPVPLHFHALAGYNHNQFGAEPGISHADIVVSTDFQVGHIAISPSLALARSFENTGHPGNHLLLGLSVAH